MNTLDNKIIDEKVNPIGKGELPKVKLKKRDAISKYTIISITFIIFICLGFIIGFILYKSIPVFKEIGFFKFIFSTIWQPGGGSKGEYGILKIIASTLMTLLISLVIAIPLTIFGSLFITEYMKPKPQKIAITFIQLLAGIPSVVFGLFALTQIGPIFLKMGAKTSNNMMTASITLAFMALPTMMTLSINGIKSVPDSYRFASLGLGLTKSRTSFGIILRAASPKIIGAIITGMARIIGETMAVALIAGNSPRGLIFDEGASGFFFSSIKTLAGTIGLEMLEVHGKIHESALYAIGLILFIVVIIINLIIIAISNLNNKKYQNKKINLSKKHLKELKTSKLNNYKLTEIVKVNAEKRFWKSTESFFLYLIMMTSIIIIISFTAWIILVVLIKGLVGFDPSAFVKIEGQRSGIFATILVTILLIVLTLIIAIPIAILVAIFLTEYSRENSKLKKVLNFSINVLASTPSIVFGVFGLTIFIIFMKIPPSIFAASITMSIVILPTLITSFEDAFHSVPQSYREAAIGMGLSKIGVIFKVVIPSAMRGLLTGSILAVSRIIGESAPVYLTLGTAVKMPSEGFLSSGATMTTQIYMMTAESSSPESIKVTYLIASTAIVLILLLNYISKKISTRLSADYIKVGFKVYWINLGKKFQYIFTPKPWKLLAYYFKDKGKKIIKLFNFKKNKELFIKHKERKKIINKIIKEVKNEK